MGVDTSVEVMRQAGPLLLTLNRLIQAIFVFEISVRLAATWPRMGRFYADGWNVFDFSIVAFSLLPVAGPLANVARLARILRVARLIGVSGELRLIMNTMLRSIPSLGHVSLLLGVLVACLVSLSVLRGKGWIKRKSLARSTSRSLPLGES